VNVYLCRSPISSVIHVYERWSYSFSFHVVVNVIFRGIIVYISYEVGENVLSTGCLESLRVHICVFELLGIMECAAGWLGEPLSNRNVYRLTRVRVVKLDRVRWWRCGRCHDCRVIVCAVAWRHDSSAMYRTSLDICEVVLLYTHPC